MTVENPSSSSAGKIRHSIQGQNAQNLDSGVRRNDGRKNRVSCLLSVAERDIAVPFSFSPDIRHAQKSARHTGLEKVRYRHAQTIVEFHRAAVAYARGSFREEGVDTEVIRMAAPVVAVTTEEIGYKTAVSSEPA